MGSGVVVHEVADPCERAGVVYVGQPVPKFRIEVVHLYVNDASYLHARVLHKSSCSAHHGDCRPRQLVRGEARTVVTRVPHAASRLREEREVVAADYACVPCERDCLVLVPLNQVNQHCAVILVRRETARLHHQPRPRPFHDVVVGRVSPGEGQHRAVHRNSVVVCRADVICRHCRLDALVYGLRLVSERLTFLHNIFD